MPTGSFDLSQEPLHTCVHTHYIEAHIHYTHVHIHPMCPHYTHICIHTTHAYTYLSTLHTCAYYTHNNMHMHIHTFSYKYNHFHRTLDSKGLSKTARVSDLCGPSYSRETETGRSGVPGDCSQKSDKTFPDKIPQSGDPPRKEVERDRSS